MLDNEKTFDLPTPSLKPDDTLIAQQDDGEFEISFADDTAEPEKPDAPEKPEARRAQNDPVEGYDPTPHYQRQLEDREREFAEREERYARALADSEKRRVATERESAKVAIDGIDVRIRTAIEAIKAAKAEQDYSAEVDFQNQLTDLRKLRDQINEMQGQLPSDQQIDAQFNQWQAEQRARRPAQSTPDISPRTGNPLADRYMQNNAWLRDPAQQQARDYLLQVDRQLASEGYDVKSPAHFEELSRRVAARFPTLGVKMLDGRSVGGSAPPLAGSRPQSPPVASARSAPAVSQPQQTRRNQVTLTANDRLMMRTMGLDPSNKAVQQRYAREKLAREQMDRR